MSKRSSIVSIGPSHKAALCQERGLRRGLVRAGRSAAGWVVLLWTACAAMPLHAVDLRPLTIAMVECSGDKYFEPAGRRIVIRSQPIRLFIRIRNTSDAAVLIRSRPERAYAIELKDQAGRTAMVKRKEGTGGEPDDDIRVTLSPGADKIITMDIDPETWEGVPDLRTGNGSKYTARVVYETADGLHLYSEPYTLIFNIVN